MIFELADDHRALLAELPAEKEGWNFGDLPLVTLSVTDGEFQVFLVTDDHLEHIVSHNWGMDAAIVPGGHDKAIDLPGDVIDLVGDRLDLLSIAQAVPGADADALWASVATTGEESVWKVVRALGLPGSVAGFLLGTTDIEDVEGITVHLARGISNAIGRSVDIMMGQPQSMVKPLWNSYESVAVERPWIIHAAVARRGRRRSRHASVRRTRPRPPLWLDALRGHRRRPHGGRFHRGTVAGQARLEAFCAPCRRSISEESNAKRETVGVAHATPTVRLRGLTRCRAHCL